MNIVLLYNLQPPPTMYIVQARMLNQVLSAFDISDNGQTEIPITECDGKVVNT